MVLEFDARVEFAAAKDVGDALYVFLDGAGEVVEGPCLVAGALSVVGC